MSIGALVVAALVAWALMRTVETPTTTTAATGTDQFPTSTVAAPTGTAPAISDTNPSTTAGAVNIPSAPTNVPLTVPQGNAPIGDKTTVARISAEDLRARVSSGAAVVVDVRDANSFAASHIPGAIHVPYATVEANLATLPRDKELVFYCT